jgi:hypothetical protein
MRASWQKRVHLEYMPYVMLVRRDSRRPMAPLAGVLKQVSDDEAARLIEARDAMLATPEEIRAFCPRSAEDVAKATARLNEMIAKQPQRKPPQPEGAGVEETEDQADEA